MVVGILPIGRVAGYVELYAAPIHHDPQTGVLETGLDFDNLPSDAEQLGLDFAFNDDEALISLGCA